MQHVSTKGYQVVESGINEYGAIRLHCWTTEKQGDRSQPSMLLHSPQSDIQLVPDPCLVELKLFPGALIDGMSAGSMRQSFLMETDLRCEQKTGGTMYPSTALIEAWHWTSCSISSTEYIDYNIYRLQYSFCIVIK